MFEAVTCAVLFEPGNDVEGKPVGSKSGVVSTAGAAQLVESHATDVDAVG